MSILKTESAVEHKKIPRSKNKRFFERRKINRRINGMKINFPDRRFFERRKINSRIKDRRENNLLIDFPERRKFERRNVVLEDYSMEFINMRREWLSKQTNSKLIHIKNFSFNPQNAKKNIENLIGAAQIPIGIAGPLKVNGEYTKGEFYIPMATTEGTLVESYQFGIYSINLSGGANTCIIKDGISISPVFMIESISEVNKFIFWINENFEQIKKKSEETTTHGKLLKITPFPVGRRIMLNFYFSTADAMGLNMVNIAVDNACKYIMNNVRDIKIKKYYLRCNLSSDKKASFFNLINSYGKEILAEVNLPSKIVRRLFNVSTDEFYDFWHAGVIGGAQAGIIGINGHLANGLSAVYTACGQDVAQIVNASIGIVTCEINKNDDLYISLKLPNLIIGTTGGGTALPTQKECLEIMDCYGTEKAKKFAEILGAFLLAGEIALYAALASGEFIQAHKRKRYM